ncbi:MAG: ATP-dependent DNA helicase RecG [Gemmatimonadetes bacterium]|nr:ATP-dependent DNA helicase RecG [Gemmatimonadota bacterium]
MRARSRTGCSVRDGGKGVSARLSQRTLDMQAMYLTGVGPGRADALRRLGVFTVRDLLMHVPHRYEDASTISPIKRVKIGEDATILGRVISKGVFPTRRGLRVFQAVVKDESGIIECAWPGQPFLDRSIAVGDLMLLAGSARFFHGRQFAPRETINFGADPGDEAKGRVLAVYPATEGLSFKQLRALIDRHLDQLLPLVNEYLPPPALEAAKLPPLRDALRMMHRPATLAEAMQGRSRLAFEELLFVNILHRRAKTLARAARSGIRFVNRRDLTSKLKAKLPFDLTAAQVKVTREIVRDMTSDERMHRLLQGDVGSGKTVVALFAALLAMENGFQAAVMAPTELLAEQHARTFAALLQPLGITPVFVSGSMSTRARATANKHLASQEPLLVVGTHALVQEGTSFGRLGLVIVDEQHRFGVEQRLALGRKGERPDVLLMSATPIPRSLALTVYGDLDVSILDELPPGRQPVTTVRRPAKAREKVHAFVNQQIDKGRQAYFVFPLIDESDKVALKAATQACDELRAGAFANRKVELLHGRMDTDARDDIMRRFRDGEVDVLVSTTVIEVGIDVPNATVMVVEHPERFGLSQLHQLRGRVGRGSEESFCILLGDVSPESEDRLRVVVESQDGFKVAEADLRLRGMGDLFGQKQHGEPTFRVADPFRDIALNEIAREQADRMLTADPELRSKENAPLHAMLRRRYERALELFRVG